MKKRWKNSEFHQFPPQDKRITHIYSQYGKTTTCNHSKIFLDGTITRMLRQCLRRWKEWLSFIIVSELICWSWVVRYQISQTFVFIALQMYKFYTLLEEDKDLLEKIREDMVGGPSIVFPRKAVVRETRIRSSSNICKSIVGIDASQLYPYAMCQPMPTGLHTRWEFNADLQRFKPRFNKARSFENMVMAFFQNSRLECIIESFYTTGTQRKTPLALMGFAVTVTQFLKLWVASITFANFMKGKFFIDEEKKKERNGRILLTSWKNTERKPNWWLNPGEC